MEKFIKQLKEFKAEEITGDLLKEFRESREPKITQQELADKLGVIRQTLARWESTNKIAIFYKKFIADFLTQNWKE